MNKLSENKRLPTDPIKPRRPFALSVVFWIFVLWILLGWLRFARVITDRLMILEWLPPGYFPYLAGAGLSWGLLGLPVLWGILRRSGWVLTYVWIVGVIYPMIYWVERLFLWASSESGGNWPFILVLTVFWFGVILWAQRAARAKKFFSEKEK